MNWESRYAVNKRRTTTVDNETTIRSQCGTRHGYDLHRKANEAACVICQDAVRDYANQRNRARGVQQFQPAACGTNGGYMKHLRENGVACEECLKAHKDHVSFYNLDANTRQILFNRENKQ